VSPSWELVASLILLRHPEKGGLHVPWMRRIAPDLREMDLGLPLSLVSGTGYIPDFLTPPPAGPLTDIGEELALVRSTPRKQVNHELAQMDEPAEVRSLPAMVAQLEDYWDRALEPDWPRVKAFLQADIQHRARQLTEAGPARLFAELHPNCAWHGDHLTVDMCFCADDVILGGRGLLLVPSAFLWEKPKVIINEPWQPTLLYPARGIGTLWCEDCDDDGLVSLLGATRARILSAVAAPASTTELAERLQLSPGGVSQHLKVLRGAGLVSAQRAGREVLYARSETAEALVAGAAA
jgi:DNA-binding transcriptional ArsR family regulator